ncbi:hypothetical protein N7457_005391 [Penicillium paradoxum]|uniref:uncharacterized protein n=1 Tax=Penicillium paradoxum TaxID=176176 RepID=UPI0025469DE4|nr:uncharacterized protein N7457_005391 [Penicillium paradoxum]KAJ5780231.1 hypothetical protein N7457_005391 [Penicillium paradoxum]
MAISVPNTCSPRLAFLDDQGPPPKQSMWHRLGLRKLWQGRDDRDTSGESQDEISPPSSDHSRAKQDNLTRRISRKVGVGLPRTHFKRQSSDLERLAPREPDHRRALSADRRPLSSERTRSPPPAVGPRQSAPEVQWLGPPTTTDFDAPDLESESDAPIDDIADWNPYPEMKADTFDDPDEIIDLDMELEQRWILNLSMHFRDRSEREKFFVTYAETPNRWRRVTISCDYHNAPPDSLEGELKELRYQRDKCAKIYESIRESLLAIQFYEGVTNLRLETSDGRLHVHVTEDVNETIPYPPISSIRHLDGAPWIPEHLLHFESHLSGFVYKINLNGRFYIKKEIPGPDTVDEFLYEINALHALKGRPSVIQVEGIVIDEMRGVVKGLLISYAEQGALVDILYEQRGKTSFARRERWAKQIVQGLCEIHESGYVQGDFTLANIVVDADDNAKIIDINRRGCPVGWEPPEIAAKIESNQRISMYIGVKTDIFQLGMTLWALAMEEDEPERQPRPLRLGDDARIPDYFRRIVDICLSPVPRHRLSAKELLSMFPPLLATRASTPARPVEVIDNDPRHLSVRNDWVQPRPTGLRLASPEDMMPQDDDYYPRKEFLENSYGGLQHPILPEHHDLVKRSTITLADSNEKTGFSSKPSSSSTLNHHESHNHDTYMDLPGKSNDQSLPSPSYDNQNQEAASIAQTRSVGNGFHDYPIDPPAYLDEPQHLENVTPNNQQEAPNGPIHDHPPTWIGSVITTHAFPATRYVSGSQIQESQNQESPRADDMCDLETSALPINPTLCDPVTLTMAKSATSSSVPSSIKPPKQDNTDRSYEKTVNDEIDLESSVLPLSPTFRDSGSFLNSPNAPPSSSSSSPELSKQKRVDLPHANTYIKPKLTETSSTTSCLSHSGLPISPAFRSSGTPISAEGISSTQGPSSVQLPKQDNVDQQYQNAVKISPISTLPSDSTSPEPLSRSPINPTLIRSWPSIDFESSPRSTKAYIEPPKQESAYLPPKASGIELKFTEPSPATSSLSHSDLPMSPTFRSAGAFPDALSIPSSQASSPHQTSKEENAVSSRTSDLKSTSPVPSPPPSPRFSSALHMSNLRHRGASFGSIGPPFASPSVVGIGLLRRPWDQSPANSADGHLTLTRPSSPTSSLGNSQAPVKASNLLTPATSFHIEPQGNATVDPFISKPPDAKPIWTSLPDLNPNLLNSKLPISPAHTNSRPTSIYTEARIAYTHGSPSSQANPSHLTQAALSSKRH